MTDLRPWLEDGADGELAELLRAGRRAKPLDLAVLARSRRRVRALERPRRRVGVLQALPAAAGVLVWVQHAALGAGLGVVVAAVAAAPRLVRHYSSAPAAANSATPTRLPPATHRPTVPVPPPTGERTVPAPPLGSNTVAFPEPRAGDDFQLELMLLERAKSELARDPETALRTLRSHRADFAGGKLGLEREFLTVTALVRLHRMVEARAYADSLRARAPGNLYDARLRQLLGDPVRAP